MFYKVLFILTAVRIICDIKGYIKDYTVWQIASNKISYEGMPIGLYVKIGISALFYIMITALLIRPYLLWLRW